jgi:hypothetical protein
MKAVAKPLRDDDDDEEEEETTFGAGRCRVAQVGIFSLLETLL